MRENKTLLVTGASSDFGMELIRTVEKQYEIILAHYYHENECLKQLKEQLGDKLVLLQADFMDIDSVNKMIGSIRDMGYTPDHIVHFPSPKAVNEKFHKCNWERFSDGIETSLHSIVDILKAFLPQMMKNKYGKIVFMLSAYTMDVPPKYQAPYVSVKYALLGLMKSLAVEYAEKGIAVNAVSPGMTETKFLAELPELIIQQNAYTNPTKRNLSVEDVIPTFAYLLSDGADAVTGQNVAVTFGGK